MTNQNNEGNQNGNEGGNNQPNNDGNQSQSGGGGQSFTQADLDRVAAQARSEERAKYSDYDELKGKAGQWDESQAANQTELEKATTDLSTANAQNESLRRQLQNTAIDSAIRVTASQAGIVDADAAVALINRQAISYDAESGTVSGVKEAVDTLIAEKSYLKGPSGPNPPNVNGGENTPSDKMPALTADELDAAARMGVSPEAYQRGKDGAPTGENSPDNSRAPWSADSTGET